MSVLNDCRNKLIDEFYYQLKTGRITPEYYKTQITAIKSIYKSLEERHNDANSN